MRLLGKYVTAGTLRGNWMTQGLVIHEDSRTITLLHTNGKRDLCRRSGAVIVKFNLGDTAEWVKRERVRRGI